MVIWIIGLAGAGKTTVGRDLHARLKARDPSTVFLDGDDVREIMGNDLGHTIADRRENAWRICRLCRYLDAQGIQVVCAILSMFEEHREWNREKYGNYFEVFLDVPIHVLAERDKKGLYSSALAGTAKNVVGVDIPFVPPATADLVLHHASGHDPSLLASLIVEALDARA